MTAQEMLINSAKELLELRRQNEELKIKLSSCPVLTGEIGAHHWMHQNGDPEKSLRENAELRQQNEELKQLNKYSEEQWKIKLNQCRDMCGEINELLRQNEALQNKITERNAFISDLESIIQELQTKNERLRDALLYIKEQNKSGYISYCGMPHEKVIDKALSAQPEATCPRPPMTSNASSDFCELCGAPEVDAMTPRTVYACGSSDYDKRPGTFRRGDRCNAAQQEVLRRATGVRSEENK